MTDKEILEAFNKSRDKMKEKAIVRPAFTLRKELAIIVIGLLLWFLCVAIAVVLRAEITTSLWAVVIISVTILFIVTQAKNALLLLIFLYQRLAPASVRSVCLFTPSCSEYMRLSVLKYGVWKGFVKGLRRLRRCHPPNGGVDEP